MAKTEGERKNMMEPIKFEIQRVALNGYGVSSDSDCKFTIFTCLENAKKFCKAKAGKGRATIVVLDADGTKLSSHKINTGSASAQ